jgi:hypothetical protein
MAQMLRKQIYLEKRQQALLRRLAKKRGVSEAEVIRQAIEREALGGPALALPLDHEAWEQALAFMQARRKLGAQGQPYRWRREDAYEERLGRFEHGSGSQSTT